MDLLMNIMNNLILMKLLNVILMKNRMLYFILISIIFIVLIMLIGIILHRQANIVEKILINLIFLMFGTVAILSELYLAINLSNNQTLYLRIPIVFSILFISVLLIFMLYNMYFIWKDISKFKNANNIRQQCIYSNRFVLFTINILVVVLIIIISYAFIYYIINNLPSTMALDLKGNFLDSGHRKKLGECIYFSAVTFFTVGYGDMIPKGLFLCGIVVLEMITSYLLGIISIPILLSILLWNSRNSKL